MEKKIYSVTEITQTIKVLIEQSLPTLWIEGEVSNFKPHYSGHFYFTLKDQDAQISAVMWRSRAELVGFSLEDGIKIQALGNIRVYEKTGRYQIDILQIHPAGSGALQFAFDQLKKKLFAEGLFSEEHKKHLPDFPENVAIVTSPTGAAIRDMLNVLKRRAPYLEIFIFPVKVQGQGAAEEIAKAIDLLNKFEKPDVIIIGRGGGSLEDLWAFNEEVLARAIYSSDIPVISAVGHEIDFTIADFVADMRAPTPSAAAELIVSDFSVILSAISDYKTRLLKSFSYRTEQLKQYILTLKNSYGLRRSEDLIYQHMQHVDEINNRFIRAFAIGIQQNTEKIRSFKKQLFNLNPASILSRGYSITYKNGDIIKNIGNIKKGDQIETRLSGGKIESTVEKLLGNINEKRN